MWCHKYAWSKRWKDYDLYGGFDGWSSYGQFFGVDTKLAISATYLRGCCLTKRRRSFARGKLWRGSLDRMLICPRLLRCCWYLRLDGRYCNQMGLKCSQSWHGWCSRVGARFRVGFHLHQLWKVAILRRRLVAVLQHDEWRQSPIPISGGTSVHVIRLSRRD